MECEIAQELRTMGQRLGEFGMFQQSRGNFKKRKWFITSNLQKDQIFGVGGEYMERDAMGTFRKKPPIQKDQN